METAYQLNQIVWGKVNGYPWWPGFVSTVSDNDQYEVVFFGDFSRAILVLAKIKNFDGIRHKNDGKNKMLDRSFQSAERVVKGESTIMDEWEKCNKPTTPKRKLSRRKSIKKADKPTQDIADDISLCLSHRSKAKYQNFLNKVEKEVKPELKRYHSVNNKITTSSYTHFIENQIFGDEIVGIEEQLEALWLALRSENFVPEPVVETINEVKSKTLNSDPKAVFNSSIGSLLTTCANVCKLKSSEPGFKQLLDLLSPTVLEICEFIIKDGFLMENSVASEYIDRSKRDSILNGINLDICPARLPDNNLIQMDKRKSADGSLFKVEEEETRNPNEAVEVDERMRFRVKKKLAKVLYTNGAKGKFSKKSCEELATKIEEFVRNTVKALDEYKEQVVTLVKNLEKNGQAVNSLVQKAKKDKGISSMEEEITHLSSK